MYIFPNHTFAFAPIAGTEEYAMFGPKFSHNATTVFANRKPRATFLVPELGLLHTMRLSVVTVYKRRADSYLTKAW